MRTPFQTLVDRAHRKAVRDEQAIAGREIKRCTGPHCYVGDDICDNCSENERTIEARESIALKTIKSLGYVIEYNPPPIPMRCCDWQYAHEDFDGAPDANDPRCGTGPDPESCLAEIEEIEEELRGEE